MVQPGKKLHVVVCLKSVLDPEAVNSYALWGRLEVDDSGRSFRSSELPRIVNAYDEQALEVALRLRDAGADCRITALTVGLETSLPMLRRAIAMGVDDIAMVGVAKGVDRDVLEGILTRYARPGNHYAYVACRDGAPIAACFVVHDERTAYYLLGGYRAENRHHGAGALAVWEAIRHAKEAGLETFDFEGSVIPPIERFFRGFGGRLTPYYTVNKGWRPLETAMKFLRRGFF